jgi:hypothetical protein
MTGYCKNCHHTHAAWTRLNNGVVCGLCGARERDLRVMPVNVQSERRGTMRLSSGRNRG